MFEVSDCTIALAVFFRPDLNDDMIAIGLKILISKFDLGKEKLSTNLNILIDKYLHPFQNQEIVGVVSKQKTIAFQIFFFLFLFQMKNLL